MNTTQRLVTAESVTEGHPDKICDQVSDAVVDDILRQDVHARVAVEAVATTGQVHLVGELSTSAYSDVSQIVRRTLAKIGYNSSEIGFDAHSCGVLISIGEQSPDIKQGVDRSDGKLGAGDQGVIFGYATDETNELFPLSALVAHKIAQRLAQVRKDNIISGLRPDGKTQVTVKYVDDVAVSVDAIVVSTQHDEGKQLDDIKREVKGLVVDFVLEEVARGLEYPLQVRGYRLFVNPTGKFVTGGPQADAGLTGRKIIVDTYGGAARHGGGCFSGKDPSKVDRCAAYALRHVAKNVVAARLARKIELQVAYAIGVVEPISLYVDTFGTSTVDEQVIARAVEKVFDLRPAGIIKELDLLRPIYEKTATYGHFGREDSDFTWERTDKVEDLKMAVKEISARG
ncbi:MAG: methionine adenosyltransferase [Candidatus Ancillula trichonymphae]|jgi:S-adenosylmethionine synthetase|nr:methionine adenosyltransferase [Candidatus Ancillula trichonymphae]